MHAGRARGWLVDLVIGGVVGGILGAIVAVNFVIYVGVESGYEATLPEVFRHSTLAGVVTVGLLAAGPLTGVSLARGRRRRRGPE